MFRFVVALLLIAWTDGQTVSTSVFSPQCECTCKPFGSPKTVTYDSNSSVKEEGAIQNRPKDSRVDQRNTESVRNVDQATKSNNAKKYLDVVRTTVKHIDTVPTEPKPLVSPAETTNQQPKKDTSEIGPENYYVNLMRKVNSMFGKENSGSKQQAAKTESSSASNGGPKDPIRLKKQKPSIWNQFNKKKEPKYTVVKEQRKVPNIWDKGNRVTEPKKTPSNNPVKGLSIWNQYPQRKETTNDVNTPPPNIWNQLRKVNPVKSETKPLNTQPNIWNRASSPYTVKSGPELNGAPAASNRVIEPAAKATTMKPVPPTTGPYYNNNPFSMMMMDF